MNTLLTPYQKRKHQQALDEIYLEKQLVFLTQHKTEILFDIREYRKKNFNSYRNHFVHSRTVVKLLNTDKRTIRLLASNKYISSYRDWETDRKSTRLNSSHSGESRMPSSA